MKDITNQEIEIIELMRDIKKKNSNDIIKLVGAMEVLKETEDKNVKYTDEPVEELIIKLLEIQNSCQFKEMRDKKKEIIEKVLHSDSIRDIKIINSFINGLLSERKIS